ncbi:MAG: DNA ligase, partial [Pseudomonadales bacterium]|nr:DNA ligase [Pseudomonadales bacterium]
MPRDHQQLLEQYRRKRRSDGTPEPFGRAARAAGGPQRFVVHHHAARNTHYDLRLEMEGVLRSWAVPKGPSPNTEDKRFAALVEDHPLEYGDFEGRIPDGNYGAGWTIVWDRGIWLPKGDPVEGMEKGKLLFELRGQKLHGNWTLVRMKSGERDWLLIKERDDQAMADAGTDDYPMNSVFTGLSLEDLDAGRSVEAELARRIARSRAKKRTVTNHRPMLAATGEAFNRKGWLFEIKYDGYRLMCVKDGAETCLLSRHGNDLSRVLPEITDAVS